MTPDTPPAAAAVPAVDADAYKAALARLRSQAMAPATDKLRRTALAVRAALAEADNLPPGEEGAPGAAEREAHAASVERARALVQPPELPAPARLPWGLRALVALGLLARP